MEDVAKKKVSLITLQNVPNYGSVLQCYATERIIKQLGYEVETINYMPKRMTKIGMLGAIKNKNKLLKKSLLARTTARIIIFPSYLKRFNTFESFRKQYLNQSEKIYLDNDSLINDVPKADIYCTGSDQVWNSEWNGGIDKALFLDFVPEGKKCIAYAASFGKSSLEKWEVLDTKLLLKKYSDILMREQSGVDIIKSLGYDASNVVDPTLLLTGDEWRIISSNRFENDKYIFVYNLNRNQQVDIYASNLSKETGLKIKYLSYQYHEFYKKGKMYCNPKVEDFLALIDNAKYVITDSFHATAFSINFNTPFVIVYPGKYSTRLQSILKITGLENRVAQDENDLDVVKRKIDFEKVNKKINIERQKSLSRLKESLK